MKSIQHNRKFALLKTSLVVVLIAVLTGCRTRPGFRPRGRKVSMLVTGYCDCGKCCGWKRNWWGRPVYAYGPNKGKPKKIGVCADGTRAAPGTVAADTRYYPFGTVFYIPGYGYGVVHDRGKAIQGARHIDIFFKDHDDALRWGRKNLGVSILGVQR